MSVMDHSVKGKLEMTDSKTGKMVEGLYDRFDHGPTDTFTSYYSKNVFLLVKKNSAIVRLNTCVFEYK